MDDWSSACHLDAKTVTVCVRLPLQVQYTDAQLIFKLQ